MNTIADLLGYVLNFLYGICGNFGIAIILFTVIIKLCLLPLNIKQQKSIRNMAKLQPKLLEIQEKYKDNQELYAQEVMKFQKEENFNPFTGCLIALIQIPIILGMFYIVSKPLTHMVKMDEAQIQEYRQELQIENTNGMYGYDEIEIIKQSDKVDIDLNFIGINLGDIPAKNPSNYALLIIPVLSVIITVLSLMITKRMNDNFNKDNPQYQETQKSMNMLNYVLPVMSGYIAYQVPLGLGLYWLFSNLIQTIISIGMMIYFNNEEKKEEGVVVNG